MKNYQEIVHGSEETVFICQSLNIFATLIHEGHIPIIEGVSVNAQAKVRVQGDH